MATRKAPPTWAAYQASIGDRSALFAALAQRWRIDSALYPGCYLDLSPSTAIADVTYVDIDKRAARYFSSPGLADQELRGHGVEDERQFAFIHADYSTPLPIPERSVDLLISLYAGLVTESCRRYLKDGGLILANASHGDASLAALDPTFAFVAAVLHDDHDFRIDATDLDTYLVPRSRSTPTPESIRASGRAVPYTREAFAYVFRAR